MYTIIIPAYNEEKTVRNVLKIAASAPNVGQVVLVDDGSTDRTMERSKGVSPLIDIVSHSTNKGKGAAVRTGIARAAFEVVLFLDADLLNITSEKIYALVEPLLNNEADFVKASFTLERGRVTELAVKPMMQILFPDNYFEQPISGQFAARLSFLKEITIVENWGLDIGILLDAISKKLRITEVFIGDLEHKAQSNTAKAKMSEQVLYTMIQKAGLLSNNYKMVLFSFDESLLKNYSMQNFMKFLGKEKEFLEIQEDFADKDILPFEYYSRVANLMADVNVDEAQRYVKTLDLRTYAKDVVDHLRRRRFTVGIIGMHFSPLVGEIAKQLDIEIVESLGLKMKGKKFTGELTRKTILQWFSGGTLKQGYLAAMHRLTALAKTDIISTIAVAASAEMAPVLEASGLGIAYRVKDKEVRKAAEKTISILPELLVLVE